MEAKILVLMLAALVSVLCKPLDIDQSETAIENNPVHKLIKRFINPSLTIGSFSGADISKIRTKRGSEDECEKLNLCLLHARSNTNFFAAFELYFVNKENARLWDHHARTLSECHQRYSCYR
ncbi:uncharacterized protein LOC125066071 [Vanessa atalanta]|uniref:uncharacterized protein LOC125066071 n=1 Tax=Vanessa atalanta TaxID=42275 RepID=UPI001FCCF0A7|nr:uncharacterized protein LOC125066071 [Vanessa atalanta]